MTETFKVAKPIWCAGCGDFAVLASVRQAITKLGISIKDVAIIAGIGCSGSLQNNYESYGYHALHGRLLPSAIGAKLVNPKLTVIALGGDGDGYAIGMGHFMHALKRNPSIVYIVMNNETYGLTKGQYSPTAHPGFAGNVEEGFDPVLTALSFPRSTFIARGFSGSPNQTTWLVEEAIKHTSEDKGFAFVEVLSPCVTYNDTYKLWRSIIYNLGEEPGYDNIDKQKASVRVQELLRQGRIPTGLIYRGEAVSFEKVSVSDMEHPAALQDISMDRFQKDYLAIMDSFKT